MDCYEARELLEIVFFEKVPDVRKQQLKDHLTQCPKCRRRFEEERRTADKLAQIFAFRPPDNLLEIRLNPERVVTLAQMPDRQGRRRIPGGRATTFLSIIGVLFLLGAALFLNAPHVAAEKGAAPAASQNLTTPTIIPLTKVEPYFSHAPEKQDPRK